jgi:TolB protein
MRTRLVLVGIPVAVFALALGVSLTWFGLTGEDEDGRAPAATRPKPAQPKLPTGAAPVATGKEWLVLALSVQTKEPTESYLVRAAIDGSDMRPLTEGVGDLKLGSEHSPVVSPDGKVVAFVRAESGTGPGKKPSIYLVDMKQSYVRRLTRGRNLDISPAWSPDGSRLAFARIRGGRLDLFTAAADGSDVTRLTHTSGDDDDAPAYSPDGKRIVFSRYPGGAENGGPGELWVINARGAGERQLLGDGRHDYSYPAWSPDGRHLALTFDGHVAVADADGRSVRQITGEDRVKKTRPSWSPDGKRIVFSREPGGVFVVNPDGSHLQRVRLDAPGFSATWGPAP